STEEKIKDAARVVFHKKGFAATRTRDIAEEAGLNLALLNYYFRSKEKLFDIIMLETMMGFMGAMMFVFNDEGSSFEEKVEKTVSSYIDLFIKEPQIPLFIMNELQRNPEGLAGKLNIKSVLLNSVFARQYQEVMNRRGGEPLHIMQFVMSLMGLLVFPFMGRPMLKIIGDLNDEKFVTMMKERKKLVPVWIEAILSAG
ncbi:MAG TPA: helix-turn-helix domain-containing protein, partial [Saprospiraceae bacterium]|nr:helix-turn-helix domain-containing protein [Saprospiraceae bacterium]